MNTAEILKECRTLPGVRVKSEKESTELLLTGKDGNGCMRFFAAFPGISLAQITVNASSWPAPVPRRCSPDSNGPLIINYCMRGRCELVLNNNKCVFLTSGQISLTEKFAQQEYVYPGRVYEGIELFIDPETVAHGSPLLSEGFGLDVAMLQSSYCPNGETYIAKRPLPDNLLSRLWKIPQTGEQIEMVGIKTAVVDFISLLLHSDAEVSTQQPSFYTRSQVEIAKQIEHIILEDLSYQHTVCEFAKMFSVSESSVKNYFFGVFGQSVSQYTAYRRMLYAAELLTETRLSVLAVANRVGYENQSKFAAAFRRVHGCSPLEYRRAKSLFG